MLRRSRWNSQLNWLDTTRVRVGWVWDHALFYGATVGGVRETANASAAAGGIGAAETVADTQTRFGWTAGAGVEYAFNNYLSAEVEYIYVNLGTQTQINVDSVKFNTNIVRAGVQPALLNLTRERSALKHTDPPAALPASFLLQEEFARSFHLSLFAFPAGAQHRVYHTVVMHDDWCAHYDGKECNCNPIVMRHVEPKR